MHFSPTSKLGYLSFKLVVLYCFIKCGHIRTEALIHVTCKRHEKSLLEASPLGSNSKPSCANPE